MRPFLRDYILAVGWYMTLVVMGLVVTLVISSAVGYLPYSDRPGPGWVGPAFSLGQLGYYASWATLLLLPTAAYGSALFAYHRLLRFLDAPLPLIRLIGAATGGIVTLVLAAAAGWYIAMAAFPAWAAAGLGALWGAAVLPRHLGPTGPARSPLVRWTSIAVVALAGPFAVYGALFAPRYGQHLQVSVIRLTESVDRPPAESPNIALEPREAALLDSLFPNRRAEHGLTGSSSSGAADHEARMLVVVTAPLTSEARLRVPRGVSAAYVQMGDQWSLFPPDAPTSRDIIRLGPGSGPDEATFTWPGGHRETLTWERRR
jgi:hypothetical protein